MGPTERSKQLGRTIRLAREKRGLSIRRLAEVSGMTHSFVGKLEAGVFQTVSADKLAALARALDVPAADLFSLAGYKVPEGLPTFGPYLRTRYGDELPEHAMRTLTDMFEAFRGNYGDDDAVDDESNDSTIAQSGSRR